MFRVPYRAELLFFPLTLLLLTYVIAKNKKTGTLFLMFILITNTAFMMPWNHLYLEGFLRNSPKSEEFTLSSIMLNNSMQPARVFVITPYCYEMQDVSWRMNLNHEDLYQIPRYYPVMSSPLPTYDTVHMNNFGKMLMNWFLFLPTGYNEKKWLFEELGINASGPVIGMGVRLSEQKGITYLLKAIPIIAREFPTLSVVIAGKGELEAQLISEAESLGINGKNVFFIGPRLDIPEILKS